MTADRRRAGRGALRRHGPGASRCRAGPPPTPPPAWPRSAGRRRSSARSATTSSATCSATTSAPPGSTSTSRRPADGPARRPGRLILVTPDAQRTMNTYLGIAGQRRRRRRRRRPRRPSSAIVFCEGYLWDSDVAKDAIEKAMDVARARRAHRCRFTLSDSLLRRPPPRRRSSRSIEQRVDMLFANEAEIARSTRSRRLRGGHRRASSGVGAEIACVTRSEQGSVVVRGDERLRRAGRARRRGRRHHRGRRPLRRRRPLRARRAAPTSRPAPGSAASPPPRSSATSGARPERRSEDLVAPTGLRSRRRVTAPRPLPRNNNDCYPERDDASPSTGPGPSAPPRPDARLLEAAAEVFAEQGYDGAGVQEIARRAGLTTGAIYSRSRGKAELLLEAIDSRQPTSSTSCSASTASRATPPTSSPRSPGATSSTPRRGDRTGNALLLEAFVAARRDPEIRDRRQGPTSRTGPAAWPRSSRRPRPTAPIDRDVDTDSARPLLPRRRAGLPALRGRRPRPARTPQPVGGPDHPPRRRPRRPGTHPDTEERD